MTQHSAKENRRSGERAPSARGLAAVALLALAAALPGWGQSRDEADGGKQVAAFVRSLRVADPLYFNGLTVVPILADAIRPAAAPATLEQGLREGWLRIVEKEGGQVPVVLLSNLSDHTVFVMAGEILSGCKQDRIVAADLLVRPWRRNLTVPVYCVEEGRWTHTSGSFGSEKNLGTFALRAKAQAASPQGEIWEEVARSNRKAGVRSATGALQDAFRDEGVEVSLRRGEESLGELPRRFPSAVGVAVALGDELVGLDLFASPDLFAELWPKILRAAVLGMLGVHRDGTAPRGPAEALLELLAAVAESSKAGRWSLRAGVDLGQELSASRGGWDLHALLDARGVVHLAAFAAGEPAKGHLEPLAPQR